MNKKAFTLIEILIALGVFGLILTGLAVLLNFNQQELRDSKRVNDMQSLRNALSVVKAEKGGFDQAFCEPGAVSACAGKAPSVLIGILPGLANLHDPEKPAKSCIDATACQKSGCNYAFVKLAADDYEVRFSLERGVDEFRAPGCYKLTPAGIIKL